MTEPKWWEKPPPTYPPPKPIRVWKVLGTVFLPYAIFAFWIWLRHVLG